MGDRKLSGGEPQNGQVKDTAPVSKPRKLSRFPPCVLKRVEDQYTTLTLVVAAKSRQPKESKIFVFDPLHSRLLLVSLHGDVSKICSSATLRLRGLLLKQPGRSKYCLAIF